MQFYIIHDDSKVNARLLPDYCLKAVNVREGYQMLCDIGHLFNVKWDGQNKAYNVYHAETRKFWKNIMCFDFFIEHYERCLVEYEIRFWNQTKFHEGYWEFKKNALHNLRENIAAYSNKYRQVIKYLLERKKKHLKQQEIKLLESIL